jgi:hypothetical protein
MLLARRKTRELAPQLKLRLRPMRDVPIGRAMNKEAVQMFATPAECILKNFVEFGDTGCADHEQSPPHQRTHAAEH